MVNAQMMAGGPKCQMVQFDKIILYDISVQPNSQRKRRWQYIKMISRIWLCVDHLTLFQTNSCR